MAYKIINTPFLLSGGKYTGKKSTETAAINDTKSDAQRREANKKVSTSTTAPRNWPYTVDGDTVPQDIAKPSRPAPPKYNLKITYNKTIKEEYIPALNKVKATKGAKVLALAMTKKEGFRPGTRSYRTNNPGNIGNTDSGANQTIKTLEKGIELQIEHMTRVSTGKSKSYPLGKIKTIKPYYSPEVDKNQKSYLLNPYFPGYKFKYTGKIKQFVKIYSTGARGANSYISTIVSVFRNNGFTSVDENTTLSELIKLDNNKIIKT